MFVFITNYLEPVACLLYLVALLLNCNGGKRTQVFPLIGHYLVATVLLTIGCFQMAPTDNNLWIYDVVSVLTSVCVGAYFYTVLQAPAKKRTVLVLMLLSLAYATIRNLGLNGPRLFDSVGYSLTSVSVVVYVFLYFHQLLKNVSEANILREFDFWLASGYLLYYVGSFVIFVSYYYLTKRLMENDTSLGDPSLRSARRLLTALWGLHNVLLFIGAITLLTSSVWVSYRRKSASLSPPRFSSY